jgi:hypothetical protein
MQLRSLPDERKARGVQDYDTPVVARTQIPRAQQPLRSIIRLRCLPGDRKAIGWRGVRAPASNGPHPGSHLHHIQSAQHPPHGLRARPRDTVHAIAAAMKALHRTFIPHPRTLFAYGGVVCTIARPSGVHFIRALRRDRNEAHHHHRDMIARAAHVFTATHARRFTAASHLLFAQHPRHQGVSPAGRSGARPHTLPPFASPPRPQREDKESTHI